MPLITLDTIEALKSGANGFKRRDLELLGVPWPPVKGWKWKVIGKPISPALADRLAGKVPASKPKPLSLFD